MPRSCPEPKVPALALIVVLKVSLYSMCRTSSNRLKTERWPFWSRIKHLEETHQHQLSKKLRIGVEARFDLLQVQA